MILMVFLINCFSGFGSLSSNLFAAILLQSEPPDFIIFLGRFHPLIVHLPIGFLFIAVALEYLSKIERFKNLGHATVFVLFLTSVGSVIAVVLGYFLSLGGGYDEQILFWHKWFGIALAAGATLAWLLKMQTEKRSSVLIGRSYIFFLIISCISLMAAGHNGGSLTHGSDYLTAYMPDPLRKLNGLPPKQDNGIKPLPNIPQAVVYTDIIQPVLNERCTNCHSSSKQKGELRLDGMEHILKGGENGKVIVVGKPVESNLYTYLLLPEGDDKHMPPKGKTQLSKEQIRLIGWWIGQGAPVDKKVAELKVPDSIQTALVKFAAGKKKPTGIFAKEIDAADAVKLAGLKAKGFIVSPIAQDVNYLQAFLTAEKDTFAIKEAQALADVAQQLAWLNLSGKKINADAISALTKFPNLSRINLANSTVDDAMLKNLSSLKNLEYLNLYGTRITDKGLKSLEGLKNLRSLYLWQTKATDAQVQVLKKKNLDLRVDMGVKQKSPAADSVSTR